MSALSRNRPAGGTGFPPACIVGEVDRPNRLIHTVRIGHVVKRLPTLCSVIRSAKEVAVVPEATVAVVPEATVTVVPEAVVALTVVALEAVALEVGVVAVVRCWW